MWEFSVGLYMINIWPDSLLYAAIYGAVESASIALFGSIIGRWVDKLCYVKVDIVVVLMAFVVMCAIVVDQDHTLGSDDLSHQDYKYWSKDYIVSVEV